MYCVLLYYRHFRIWKYNWIQHNSDKNDLKAKQVFKAVVLVLNPNSLHLVQVASQVNASWFKDV